MSADTVHLLTVPQLGVNDDVAILNCWLGEDGSLLAVGDPVCVLETSKATFTVESEVRGYLGRLAEAGEEVATSQEIALIVSTLEAVAIAKQDRAMAKPTGLTSEANREGGSNATRKARELAATLGVDLRDITSAGIIRESEVLLFHRSKGGNAADTYEGLPVPATFALEGIRLPILVYGSGAGGKTVAETVELGQEYQVVGYVDDKPAASTVMGKPVWRPDLLPELARAGVRGLAVAIANWNTRVRILRQCDDLGLPVVNVIHPTAYVSPSAKLGRGNFIKARAVIETDTRVGDACIIDNGAIVAHDNVIEDGCHLAPGVSLGSSIHVGQGTVVGIGASISTKIRVGRECIISVGSSVTRDVPDYSVVEGVPGKIIGSREKR